MIVYVLYGGKSVEHEISKMSGLAVINGIDKENYCVRPIYITPTGIWELKEKVTHTLTAESLEMLKTTQAGWTVLTEINDAKADNNEVIVFPVLHGTHGEDGTIQGLLEILDVPYVGSGVAGSSIGMDKVIFKKIMSLEKIPQTKHLFFDYDEWSCNERDLIENIENNLQYPIFIKPACSGSSIGITKCQSRKAVSDGINFAFQYDNKVVIEQGIDCREMQISVIGNDRPMVSMVGEFMLERPFMDYSSKYLEGELVRAIEPNLPEEILAKMKHCALKVFKSIEATGLARIDFFVDNQNRFYVNEVNTMPGFTTSSMTPVLWEKTKGWSYTEFLSVVISYAIERHALKHRLSYSWRIHNDYTTTR